jgi:RimJ/RimL family protein N-acetyltransferase
MRSDARGNPQPAQATKTIWLGRMESPSRNLMCRAAGYGVMAATRERWTARNPMSLWNDCLTAGDAPERHVAPHLAQGKARVVVPKAHNAAARIPIIETERLTMRGHRLDDFAECAAMWADADVTRYIGGKPLSAEEVRAKILRYVGHWSLMGFGYWVIEEKVSGRFVGEVGFADFKRIEASFDREPEIGWALAAWAQGIGLATEAVGAAVAWGERHFGTARTVCLIHRDNVASIRLATKCGYREFGRTTYKDQPTMLFRR